MFFTIEFLNKGKKYLRFSSPLRCLLSETCSGKAMQSCKPHPVWHAPISFPSLLFPLARITVWYLRCTFIFSIVHLLTPECKLHGGRDICLFCFLLCLWCLEHCPSHSSCLKSVCWMNKEIGIVLRNSFPYFSCCGNIHPPLWYLCSKSNSILDQDLPDRHSQCFIVGYEAY